MHSLMTAQLFAFHFRTPSAVEKVYNNYGKGKVFLKSAVTNLLFHTTKNSHRDPVLPETQLFDILCKC